MVTTDLSAKIIIQSDLIFFTYSNKHLLEYECSSRKIKNMWYKNGRTSQSKWNCQNMTICYFWILKVIRILLWLVIINQWTFSKCNGILFLSFFLNKNKIQMASQILKSNGFFYITEICYPFLFVCVVFFYCCQCCLFNVLFWSNLAWVFFWTWCI